MNLKLFFNKKINNMPNISIPISVGELIDKITILKIKTEKINDIEKLEYIYDELRLLEIISVEFLEKETIIELYNKLYDVNKELWGIEESIRIKENNREFDSDFIQLSRKVYLTNDLRFKLKNEINQLTNSSIKEQKSY